MNTDLIAALRPSFVRHSSRERPHSLFASVALDFGVTIAEVSRAWESLERGGGSSAQPAQIERHVRPLYKPGAREWKDVSPAGNVVAEPGALAVLPMNALLIKARIESGLTPGELAWMAGMRQTDYKGLEEGRLLPTEVQAARLSYLLKIPVRNLFVAAAGEPFGSGRIKGLSVLQLLRCRRRLSVKDVCAAPECAGVRSALVSAIERGSVKLPLPDGDQQGVEKLAAFFGVTVDAILGTLPPEVFERVAQNTAALHDAMKAAKASLPRLGLLEEPVQPPALGDGGKRE